MKYLLMMMISTVLIITGCVKKQPEPQVPIVQERIVEVTKTETVEVPVYECDWVKPILISNATAKILKNNITPDTEEDVAKIYKHNAQYEVACGKEKK